MAEDQFAQSQSTQSGHFARERAMVMKEKGSQSPLGGVPIRCDLLGKFVGGWVPPFTLARLVCCAGPGRISPHSRVAS